MKRILWMDNDTTYIKSHKLRLQRGGYEVVQEATLTAAEEKLVNERWDLVLIDIMMNIRKSEEASYPPSKAESGHSAGFVFYERMCGRIIELGAKVAFLSMRSDEERLKSCRQFGIPERRICYKMDVADTAVFMRWVETCLIEEGVDHA